MATSSEQNRYPATENIRAWPWLMGIGVLTILLGFLAILTAPVATLISVFYIGLLFIVASVFQVIYALTAGQWTGFGLHLFVGVLYGVAGIFLVGNPMAGTISLTVLLAYFFLATGSIRAVAAVSMDIPYWGWAILSGAITFALGIYVLSNLTVLSVYALGVVFGVDLIFYGLQLASFAYAVKILGTQRASSFGRPLFG